MSEEIKYEAVFGSQALFDKFRDSENCLIIYKNIFEPDDYAWGSKPESIEKHIQKGLYPVAMRRIIKTPVWTKVDQQAGRLPDVGAIIHYINDIKDVEFVGSSADRKSWVFKRNDGSMMFAPESCFKSIETPEERAKREEDEFYLLVKDEWFNAKSVKSESFELGVRAAYRKLKMPEATNAD